MRGPLLLIALGSLIAIDHAGGTSFGRTWPALIILYGLFKLVESMGAKSVAGGQQ